MKAYRTHWLWMLLTALLAIPAQAAPEYTLSLNLAIAPIHNRWTMAIKPWADEITKRSNGRIVIEPYFAQALSKQGDVMESVRTGASDIGESTFTVGGLGMFPFHEQILNLTLPSYCTNNAAELISDLHKIFPKESLKDVEGTKLLFIEGHSVGMVIGTRGKPVLSLDELKGMKIGVPGGGIRVARIKALGATVVGVTMSDLYMALEKGIIDGAALDFEVLISRKLGDIIKNVTLINLGGSVFYGVMNQDLFDQFPPDLQKVIDDVSRDVAPKLFNDFWNSMQYASLEEWQNTQGGKVFMLSAEDYAKADEQAQTTEQDWIAFSKSKGLPAEAILRTYRELEHKHMVPWATSRAASYVKK